MAVSGRKALPENASSVSQGSGEDFDIFCQPCDRDDIRLSAHGFCVDCEEHLCESCYNHHKRAKPSRHHKLLDKLSMPQTQQIISTFDVLTVSDDLTKPCSIHKKEMIKFYCSDHKELLCGVCVTLQHPSTACQVDYIPNLSANLVDSKEYREVLKEIDTVIEENENTAVVIEKMAVKSNDSLTNSMVEMKKFRQGLNQTLDVLEHELTNAAESLKGNNDRILKKVATTCDDVKKVLQESSDTIKQCNTSTLANKLFLELKIAEQLISENKTKLIPAEDLKEYYFKPNLAMSSFLEKDQCLGILTDVTMKVSRTSSVTLTPKQFSHQDNLNAKTSQDKGICWITGMTIPSSDKLIIADYKNMSIKIFDINRKSLVDQLLLGTTPWDVTQVSENTFAVTLPFDKRIQFVLVSFNKLAKIDEFKVDGKCYGIHCHQGQLIVTFEDPAKLQIIDLYGKVLSTVTKNSYGEDIFRRPSYVTAESSRIYVSDGQKKEVIQLNWQGSVTGTYRELAGSPKGITLMEDGSLLLCDMYVRNCNIPGDSASEQVNKDIKAPYAICWCEATSSLYISRFSQNEADDNFIQVSKIS